MDFVSFIVPEFGKAKEVSYLQHPTKHVVKKKKDISYQSGIESTQSTSYFSLFFKNFSLSLLLCQRSNDREMLLPLIIIDEKVNPVKAESKIWRSKQY